MVKKKKQHYVNNADLFDAMVEYKNSVAEAEKLGNKKPRVPMFVGESIMKISTHLSFRPIFANYTFR